MGPGSADNVHLLAEVMKLAYADRSSASWRHGLLRRSDRLADQQRLRDDDLPPRSTCVARGPRATSVPAFRPLQRVPDTTHFSIMDDEGNAVANTYTLNFSYGSHIAVTGAGFLLNNEMDDFSAKVGVPNAFGLVGRRGQRDRGR